MTYQSLLRLLPIVLLGAFFTACEDPIDVPSQFEEPRISVDAWLTNTVSPQTIRITETVDYFAGGAPRGLEGATVSVCKEGTTECAQFTDAGGGEYVWLPEGVSLGAVGDSFTLSITLDDVVYSAGAGIFPTATIDSIGIEFEEESLQFDEGFYAQLYARDQVGIGNTYWIRAYKNDTLLNRPEEITIIFDSAFDPGTGVDGLYFIPPLRFGINPLDEDGAFIPYVPGDRIYAEVHSINLTAYRFLNIAQEQITNEGIFAVPVANAPSNIVNTTTGEAILGIFNIAEVAGIEEEVME